MAASRRYNSGYNAATAFYNGAISTRQIPVQAPLLTALGVQVAIIVRYRMSAAHRFFNLWTPAINSTAVEGFPHVQQNKNKAQQDRQTLLETKYCRRAMLVQHCPNPGQLQIQAVSCTKNQ